jgi:hypothetical protein
MPSGPRPDPDGSEPTSGSRGEDTAGIGRCPRTLHLVSIWVSPGASYSSAKGEGRACGLLPRGTLQTPAGY